MSPERGSTRMSPISPQDFSESLWTVRPSTLPEGARRKDGVWVASRAGAGVGGVPCANDHAVSATVAMPASGLCNFMGVSFAMGSSIHVHGHGYSLPGAG